MSYHNPWLIRRSIPLLLLAAVVGSKGAAQTPAQADARRAMTFLDAREMARAGSWAPSRDGKWALYTVTTPDWQADRTESDIHLVSLTAGLPSHRQMTFTKEKDETSPKWSYDGSFFVFLSNRDAPSNGNANQLYLMRPDGGEARKITDAKDGVTRFAFSPDGRWLVFRAGKSDEGQLWRLPVDGIVDAKAEQITQGQDGVEDFQWAPDGKRIYFTRPDTVDTDNKLRREKKFTVNVRNEITPLSSLWVVDLDPMATTRLTHDSTISVSGFTLSHDGRWVGFTGSSADRYERNITEERLYADLFLLDTGSGAIERLTDNTEVGESGLSFSPDSKWIAFSAPRDTAEYSMTDNRLYLRAVDDRGGHFRRLGDSFDGDVSVDFWSADGKTIYFGTGVRATTQLMALDIAKNTVRQVTDVKAAVSVDRDDDSGAILINYSDPMTPPTEFTVASLDKVADRASWKQLDDVNPEAKRFLLGEEEEITWTSTDGKKVGGVLRKPVGYQAGKRYPLLVAIHGGPAGADVLRFNGGYGTQPYAGDGWVVLMPNYRGSTNYGNAFQTAIVGNYFPQGFDDIMTGVDYLIAQGIADPDKMGVLGWSAGGHWSDWILTHTDRFKAISTGAGTSNWISMYAESDVQRNRQFYLGNKLPYDDFDAYWNQSPLKYVKNAKTPTMIHVVEGDPRVPSPQSIELHMALKKLGVPTELFMYPGHSHGIPDSRNQYVKAVAEKAWMDYWVLGIGERFQWRDVLSSLDGPGPRPRVSDEGDGGRSR